MNGIQDPGINNFLSRRLNITDSPGPASTLAPEVMPVLQVEAPRITDDFLRGTRLAGAHAIAPAVALEFAAFRIANTPEFRGLLIIEELIVILAAGVFAKWGIVPTAATLSGGIVASGSRDGRIAPSTTPQQTAARVSVGSAGTESFTTIGKSMGLVACDIQNQFRPEIVLAPGQSFDLWCQTVNTAMPVTVKWRERRAQPSELA